ncbi:hypothetical protein [Methanobacterium aggregans]|uniref:hypothetical protein n=1 Tax=Methanobacterium aggregans TaxID=1615586 RepID=UPI001AEAE81A|nr:hypothetical protein [Methanobacterium aggregans]MBP2045488.1 hypothetical protein [Methanobacterium aggregans]
MDALIKYISIFFLFNEIQIRTNPDYNLNSGFRSRSYQVHDHNIKKFKKNNNLKGDLEE